MKVYLQIKNNKIMSVDIEKNNDNFIEYNVNNIDDLLTKLDVENIEFSSNDIEKNAYEIFEDIDVFNKTYEIKHWVSNRSFGELIDMYISGEIKKPEMQREFVWDTIKCSRLIESIIMGLPIPPLFLLEVEKNKYEIIDGYQRLTSLSNYVNGQPWHPEEGKSKSPARLSKKVMPNISGKTFEELDTDSKRDLKRNTIPLIEFKQLTPGDLSSKYLIYERINTGSEKLNEMQIRRSLSYGDLIKTLYDKGRSFLEFNNLFTTGQIKKDQNIEALLRIKVMSDVYEKNYELNQNGLKNILNDYCEVHKKVELTQDFINVVKEKFKIILTIFSSQDVFKRVEKDEKDNFIFKGNMNIAILESYFAVSINNKITKSLDDIYSDYLKIMYDLLEQSKEGKLANPFSVSTGAKRSIERRMEIWEEILGVK